MLLYISESVLGVAGTHALGNSTSDNDYRLVSFANTFFKHKRFHLAIATRYPADRKAYASMKDYDLVEWRMKPAIIDARVHKGGDMDSDHCLIVAKVIIRVLRKKYAMNRPTDQLYNRCYLTST